MPNREMHHRVKRIFLCCVLFILPSGVWALPYSSVLAFGDGLSDNGNADGFGITRFSNGPVWVEYLSDADHLNAPLFDVAFGGATTGYDNPAAGMSIWGLNWQVDYYLANVSAMVNPDTLVTIWAGANDLFQGRPNTDAASNVELAALKLASAGFQNFLVMNLPNIGLTPAFSGTPAEVGATLWSQAFNANLAADLLSLRIAFPNVNFYTLDTYSLLNEVMADPLKYGFDNVTGTWTTRPAGDTGTYLFWDGVRPTTEAHKLIAAYAAAAATPVPEPATLLLLGSGLLGLAGFRRRLK